MASDEPLAAIGEERPWPGALTGGAWRTLEEYEGPLLSVHDVDGQLWLHAWRDCDDRAHRWLVVRTTEERVQKYLRNELSLLALLTAEVDGWLLDTHGGQILRTAAIVVADLPDDYMPEPTAMHDRDLRPEAQS